MATPFYAASGIGDVQLIPESRGGHDEIIAISARESAAVGGAAGLVLRDGADAAALPLVFVSLAAAGSSTIVFPEPISASRGVFLDRTAGTSEVVLHVR